MELIAALELAAIALSLAYLVLAAKESVWCWPPAFIASGIFAYVTYERQLVGEAFLQLFYVGMAVYGYHRWTSRGRGNRGTLPISEWKKRTHLLLIGIGLAGSIVLGLCFERLFGSVMPYLDAMTTVFSLIATYMVARKVLSNWLYWVAIDALNVFLYWHRDLHLTSGLYLLYAILAVWGYFHWRETWRRERAS